jgi:flagellar biosynthesis/type III secretory pathway M-ring protein FliF/YscJ
MLDLVILLAQVGDPASPINPQTVPGAVQIPTWLVITAIIGLVAGIVSLFGILMKVAKDHQRSHEKKDEEHGKTLKEKEEEHTKQLEIIVEKLKEQHKLDAGFWQKIADNKDQELANLGAKLDDRHNESIILMKETGQSLKIVDLVIQELRKTQRG